MQSLWLWQKVINLLFVLACINIVVAANAGGAFSPFGDITTLMVWQKGVIPFTGFFSIFIPSAVNYIIPAAIMYFAIPKENPEQSKEKVTLKPGAVITIFLFLGTITLTVISHQKFHLPTTFGMITGLGVLSLFGFFSKRNPALVIQKIQLNLIFFPRLEKLSGTHYYFSMEF